MAGTEPGEWWDRLPAGIREQVDGYVLQDSLMSAIRIVRQAGRGIGLGLNDAMGVVQSRYDHLGGRVARTPDSPLDPASLGALADGCPGRIVAIEAVWDGDTVHDWFVDLLAITDDPVGEQSLARIYRGAGARYVGTDAVSGPRHPSAAAAVAAGGALAARLSVPFHFASPDTPDDEAPRWRPPSA
ncbi:hypothetical protein OG900_24810 [Streptomyces sp. NBC_00433]